MLDSIADLKTVPRISKFDGFYGSVFTKSPLELIESQRLQKIYGNLFINSSIILPNVYNLCGANEIAHVYNNPDTYIKKYNNLTLFSKAFGQGFINNNGAKYLDRKKNILNFFKITNLKNYLIEMNQVLDHYVTQIQADTHQQIQAGDQATINIEKYSTAICLDIAFRVFFKQSVTEEFGDLAVRIKNLNSAYMITPLVPRKYYKTLQEMHDVKAAIKQIISSCNSNDDSNIVHRLNAYSGPSGDKYQDIDEIADEIFTLLLTGHETSATSVSFALALLQMDSNYKQLVLDEISNLSSDTITYEELQSCGYTRMLIEESMRMYPPIWRTLRYSVEQDVINGYYIPAKSYLLSNIFVLHRNPEYWHKPEHFNPYRFSPENKHNIHKNSYMPFIIGSRGCVASNFAMVEVQLILTKLLRHFKFKIIPGTKIELAPYVSLRMKDDFHMLIEKMGQSVS